MKYYLLLTVALAGCSTVPVKQTMPVIPEQFPDACGDLKTLPGDKVTLSKLLETVATNYGKYHECALLYENLYQWYNRQRSIFNQANN